jgi:hypothetical protein
MSYSDGEDVELVGGSVRKPDPIVMERGEYMVNRDEAHV